MSDTNSTNGPVTNSGPATPGTEAVNEPVSTQPNDGRAMADPGNRPTGEASGAQSGELLDAEPAEPTGAENTSEQLAGDGEVIDHSDSARVSELQAKVKDLTGDLQRIQAEYINYKRRVDRDKGLQRSAGIEAVLLDLLPVLDDLRTARQHEELSGGFKLLAEELEKVTRKYGLQAYGEKGDPFDPQLHEALMQAPQPGVTEPICLDVMQQGYRHNDRVLRAARVAVAVPADEPTE